VTHNIALNVKFTNSLSASWPIAN